MKDLTQKNIQNALDQEIAWSAETKKPPTEEKEININITPFLEQGAKAERTRLKKLIEKRVEEYFHGLTVIPFPEKTKVALTWHLLSALEGEE